MKLAVPALLAAALFFLTSCASSRFPVGLPLDQDLSEDLTQVWANPEGTLHVHCDEKGNLQIAMPEWDEGAGAFKMKGAQGPLLRLNDDFYVANLRDPDEGEDYMFALIKLADDKIVSWPPRVDTLKQLVKDGALEGKPEQYSVTLTGPGKTIAEVIAAKPLAEIFDLSEPSIFWKSPRQ